MFGNFYNGQESTEQRTMKTKMHMKHNFMFKNMS